MSRYRTLEHSTTARAPRFTMRPMTLAVHLLVVACGVHHAQAQPSTYQQPGADSLRSYSIPAGPLNTVLVRFLAESGVLLSGSTELAKGKHSPGVQGAYAPGAALSALLAGTGLDAVSDAQGRFVLRPGARPATREGEAALPAVQVTANAERSLTTEGTGSYAARSTASATGLVLSPRETPQSVSVVTQQRLEDQDMQTITDVLANVTGVSRSQYDGDRATFYARGFSITNYLYDGIPTSFTANWHGGESELDSLLYDRIEVVRGATGLMTGTGNPSASINLIRKHADSKVFTGSAALGVGSWNNYRASVDLSTALNQEGSVRGRFIASYQDKDSYTRNFHGRKDVLYGIVDADLTSRTKLSLGIDYQDNQPKGSSWGGMPLWYSDGSRTDWGTSVSTAAKWAHWSTRTQTAFANLEHQFDSGWKANLGYTFSKQSFDTELLYLYGAVNRDTGLGLNPVAAAYNGSRKQNTLTAQVSGPFTLLGRQHELVVGTLLSEQKALYNYSQGTGLASVGSFYDWTGDYPRPVWSAATTLEQYDTKQLAAYTTARFSLADPLHLILGGRMNRWTSTTLTANQEFNKFTPYAGLVYDLNDQLSLYTSYTAIFEPQAYRDSTGNYLDPISGKNYEIGSKAEFFDGRLNASLALFRIEQDNVAQADIGNVVPNTTQQAYYGAKGVTSKGFEAEVSGELFKGLNASLGFSRFQARDAKDAEVNTNQPRTLVRMFATYKPSSVQGLTVGGGVNWQSRNYTMASGPNGLERVEQGAYALVSVLARYEINPRTSVQLNINNLMDKKYYSQVGFYNQGAWGAPRNLMATVKHKF